MNFNLNKGQRLILELSDKNLLEGDYESGTKHQIDLINIIDLETRNPIQGRLTFYQHEIVTLKVLESDSDSNSSVSESDNSSASLESNVIALPRAEYERLQAMAHNYIYFATVDKRYNEAIEHLNSCENIGIVGLGADFGPMKPIDLLVLSSWDQIYIFDLFLYQYSNFPVDLKDLLESQYIKKVGHHLLQLVESLWHCHGVSMKNIFDTEVADAEIEKKKPEGQILEEEVVSRKHSLSECLKLYFNFPSAVIDEAGDITSHKWKARPLTNSRKVKASFLVVYLIILKNKLEYLMLQNFYDSMNTAISNIHKCRTYQGCVKFRPSKKTNAARRTV